MRLHCQHSWLCERVSTEGFGIASGTQLEDSLILRVQHFSRNIDSWQQGACQPAILSSGVNAGVGVKL